MSRYPKSFFTDLTKDVYCIVLYVTYSTQQSYEMYSGLPTCNWTKIIKRSRYQSWEGRLKIIRIFVEGPTKLERVTVVWKNGDRITYTAKWLDRKCPRAMSLARKRCN
jgi:hypothetical protein